MRPVRLVRQEHSHECGIACIAMIAGLTIEQAREAFDRVYPLSRKEKGFAVTQGITYVSVDAVLAELGFAVARLWKPAHWCEKVKQEFRPRSEWPPQPFADAHLVQVTLPAGAHFVVWLRDGTWLDPAGVQAYPNDSIQFVAAVVPV